MKQHLSTIIITFVAATSIVGAVGFNAFSMSQEEDSALPLLASPPPKVSVVEATAQTYSASIQGFGEAIPRYSLELTSDISGAIDMISNQFATGNIVTPDDTLASLNDTSYRAAVASAKANLANATVALMEEEHQAKQALNEWQSSGLASSDLSPLVLRAPQLAAAQAELDNAKVALENAERDLSRTQISSPFNALIVTRDIQLGSYVQSGDVIATLMGIDVIEIKIPLSAAKWSQFDLQAYNNGEPIEVILSSFDKSHTWTGYVTRVENHLDEETRQRSVIVAVDQPLNLDEPLLPNTYLQAQIAGKKHDSLIQLPQTALSKNGDIWYVDNNNQLNKYEAELVYEDDQFIYIRPLNNSVSSLQAVVRPLNSYVVGNEVTPVLTLASSNQYQAIEGE